MRERDVQWEKSIITFSYEENSCSISSVRVKMNLKPMKIPGGPVDSSKSILFFFF